MKGARRRGKRRGGLLLFVFLLGAAAGAVLFSVSAGRFDFGGAVAPIPKDAAQPPAASAKKEPKILYYVDPMNPANKSDKPGIAPCGMDMVPVYEDQGGENVPPGSVKVTPEKQQLIGVRYGTVEYGPFSVQIRTVGRVAYDETKLARVQARIDGWISEVYADFPGKYIKKGEPLLSIYSPDLVSTQQELLIAKKAKDTLSKSGFEDIGNNSESLYRSTRQRLKLWNITDRQIDEIEKRGAPETVLRLYSPVSGFIITRNSYPGQRISPETELYSIADLSTIWVLAEVYEYEVPLVKYGQPAAMELTYFPGETFKGKVAYIYPQLNAETRTLRIRLDFENPGYKLKPDMYANVMLKSDLGDRMWVPESAVLDSGAEQTVFVAREDGYFEPRKVELGARADNRYVVLSGLNPGEKIVTSGNFLIDSESRLKSAAGGMAGMPGMSHQHEGETPAETGGEMPPEHVHGGAPATTMPPMPGMPGMSSVPSATPAPAQEGGGNHRHQVDHHDHPSTQAEGGR